MIDPAFWQGRSVLLTGHTGFKGSWLALWLHKLGAQVTGCALAPATGSSLFDELALHELIDHRLQDIRDRAALSALVEEVQPSVVLHLAAQSLVRYSYQHPAETYETNVMGTLNLLEAVRAVPQVGACLVVTSDKCYENREQGEAYREEDPLGGFDPYSSSKGCAEILTASWRRSFFAAGTRLASARAGNVIGGGDRAEDRLVPDFIRALEAGQPLSVRNPGAVRPWQHVLEPLAGYLELSQAMIEGGAELAGAWNFGPNADDVLPVSELVEALVGAWGDSASWEQDGSEHPHEAGLLSLDSSKARRELGWQPRLGMSQCVEFVVDWYRRHGQGESARSLCLEQLERYEAGR